MQSSNLSLVSTWWLDESQERSLPLRMKKNSYILDLGGGLSMCLTGTEESQPWLERLAGVMRLRAGYNDAWPRVIFRWNRSEKMTRRLSERISAQGWKAIDLVRARIWSNPKVGDLFCELIPDEDHDQDFFLMSLGILSIYIKAIDRGGLPLHGGLVERNGLGIILAGASGRGKSTCCRRLSSPWRAMCDDETLLIPGGSQGYLAHPFPTWSDLLRGDRIKSWDVQTKVPLSAIFFLEQAQTDEVVSIGPTEAAVRMNQSANQIFGPPAQGLEKTGQRSIRTRFFQNSCDMSKSVKAYLLKVSLRGRFWDRINDVLPWLEEGVAHRVTRVKDRADLMKYKKSS